MLHINRLLRHTIDTMTRPVFKGEVVLSPNLPEVFMNPAVPEHGHFREVVRKLAVHATQCMIYRGTSRYGKFADYAVEGITSPYRPISLSVARFRAYDLPTSPAMRSARSDILSVATVRHQLKLAEGRNGEKYVIGLVERLVSRDMAGTIPLVNFKIKDALPIDFLSNVRQHDKQSKSMGVAALYGLQVFWPGEKPFTCGRTMSPSVSLSGLEMNGQVQQPPRTISNSLLYEWAARHNPAPVDIVNDPVIVISTRQH